MNPLDKHSLPSKSLGRLAGLDRVRASMVHARPPVAALATTVFVVLSSMGLTVLAMALSGHWSPESMRMALAISALVPALAAPPTFLFIFRLLAQVERQRHLLSELAVRDELTGLSNRRQFIELASIEVARSKRHGDALSLVLIDIDHFKAVNDNHGHAVGDRVLRAAARSCLGPLRSHDTLARYGGEEFVVLLPSTALGEAQVVAEKLRRAVQSKSVVLASGQTLGVTITLGVAQLTQEVPNLESLIGMADQALYAGKAKGRNCWVAAQP